MCAVNLNKLNLFRMDPGWLSICWAEVEKCVHTTIKHIIWRFSYSLYQFHITQHQPVRRMSETRFVTRTLYRIDPCLTTNFPHELFMHVSHALIVHFWFSRSDRDTYTYKSVCIHYTNWRWVACAQTHLHLAKKNIGIYPGNESTFLFLSFNE